MAEPFEPQSVATPSSIGGVRIILRIPSGGVGTDTVGEYWFEVLDQNGAVLRTRQGLLAPHLTTTEKQGVVNFMNAMLAKAVASLPG